MLNLVLLLAAQSMTITARAADGVLAGNPCIPTIEKQGKYWHLEAIGEFGTIGSEFQSD